MDSDRIRARLRELGRELPPPPGANGSYRPWMVDADLLVTSGQVSRDGDRVIEGPVRGADDLPRAREAAQVAILRCLAALAEATDHGVRVRNVVSLRGFIACVEGFGGQPKILDAASDLLVEVLGDRGEHVRSAIGVSSLPSNGLVELELTVRCEPATGSAGS